MARPPVIGDDGEFADARERLHRCVSGAADPEEAVEKLVELGKEMLDVENVHVAQIEPAADHWQALESTDRDDGLVHPGQTFDLSQTYCRRVMAQGETIALHRASDQGWATDPAFQLHGLETYLGIPTPPGEEPFGTTCFISKNARDHPFTRDERLFAEQLSFQLGQLIERQELTKTLERREQLSAVLRRILRHNLRNDLTVILGHSDVLFEKVDSDLSANVEALSGCAERLKRLTGKTRDIDQIVDSLDDEEDLDLGVTMSTIADRVREKHPQASFELDVPNTTVPLSPAVERALYELVENAAKHGGDPARVAVSGRIVDGAIHVRIEDDGPGMPVADRRVLDGVTETPLDHGSGIGLWLAFWIVNSLDGEIELLSSSDGTEIEVRVPLLRSPFE